VRLGTVVLAKQVKKGWGREFWLHEDDAPFSFKVNLIKAGMRTSLQFHERKRETYFIASGNAKLHYIDNASGAVVCVDFCAGTVGHISPGGVHRVEAVTDVILIEASTADDGSDNVRVSDDFGRPSGRIDAEHR
jgi:mannose-6-phosphate isomerase-like protein (cupin superfamily)